MSNEEPTVRPSARDEAEIQDERTPPEKLLPITGEDDEPDSAEPSAPDGLFNDQDMPTADGEVVAGGEEATGP